MIYVETNENKQIVSVVDTKRIVGFIYDGTSPEYESRYILKLEWGHTLTVGALAMQHILGEMKREESEE